MDKLDIVDSETVCAVFGGITDRTLRTWVKDYGCPSRKDGRSVTFYFPDVLAWYVGYAYAKQNGPAGDFPATDEPDQQENLPEAMLRKTKAEADMKTLVLSKLRGETINISDAKDRVERAFSNAKAKLLSLAPKLSTRLAGDPDPGVMESAIREEMETICRELSTGQIVGIQEAAADSETIETLAAASEESEEKLTDAELEVFAEQLIDTYTLLAAAEVAHASL